MRGAAEERCSQREVQPKRGAAREGRKVHWRVFSRNLTEGRLKMKGCGR